MSKAQTSKEQKSIKIEITAPNFKLLPVRVEGTSPLMMNKFSHKAQTMIREKQESENTTKRTRTPKDYAAEYNAARYVSNDGWDGVPAATFRNAMISACRMVSGLSMVKAKGLLFVKAQGLDSEHGTSLVRIHGKPVHDTRPVRLESGVADMRNRPRYDSWACDLDVEYDADQLSAQDVANLLARAGAQGGIGEMRPSAPNSNGGEFGLFKVTERKKISRRGDS